MSTAREKSAPWDASGTYAHLCNSKCVILSNESNRGNGPVSCMEFIIMIYIMDCIFL